MSMDDKPERDRAAHNRKVDWDAVAEELGRRWNAGESASQIAKSFGVTRNAVIGQVSRRKLCKRVKATEPRAVAKPVTLSLRGPAAGRSAANPGGSAGREQAAVRKFGLAGNGAVFEVANVRPPRAFAEDPAPVSGSRGLKITDEGFGGCRWPINTPAFGQGHETQFCCAPREAGQTYCAGHRAMAFSGRPAPKISLYNPDRIRTRNGPGRVSAGGGLWG